MPISLVKARRAVTDTTKTVTVEFAGETMDVTYRIGAMSRATIRRFETAKDEEQVDAAITFITEVVSAWEVVDLDGAVLPIPEEVLSSLPIDFLTAIIGAVMTDVQVPKASEDSSFAG
jgi:hypothetical protein